jgi:hypothetical protein
MTSDWTKYDTLEEAEAVAAEQRAREEREGGFYRYNVRPFGQRWVVTVIDEESGEHLGAL